MRKDAQPIPRTIALAIAAGAALLSVDSAVAQESTPVATYTIPKDCRPENNLIICERSDISDRIDSLNELDWPAAFVLVGVSTLGLAGMYMVLRSASGNL